MKILIHTFRVFLVNVSFTLSIADMSNRGAKETAQAANINSFMSWTWIAFHLLGYLYCLLIIKVKIS